MSKTCNNPCLLLLRLSAKRFSPNPSILPFSPHPMFDTILASVTTFVLNRQSLRLCDQHTNFIAGYHSGLVGCGVTVCISSTCRSRLIFILRVFVTITLFTGSTELVSTIHASAECLIPTNLDQLGSDPRFRNNLVDVNTAP
jgi:hypothetical protein